MTRGEKVSIICGNDAAAAATVFRMVTRTRPMLLLDADRDFAPGDVVDLIDAFGVRVSGVARSQLGRRVEIETAGDT